MDYIGIIKKAYQLTIKNKFLWIFGIFAGAAGGGVSGLNSLNYREDSLDWSKISSKYPELTSATLVDFWAKHAMVILMVILIGLLVFLALFILSIISQGALISAADKLGKGETANFGSSFRIGAKNFWRIWGVMILYLLMILASVMLLAIPAIILILSQLYALAIGWVLMFLCVDLIFWLLMGVISPFSFRVVVLESQSVWTSIRESLHFVRQNLLEILVIYLLLWASTLVFGLMIGLGFLLVAGILFAIGYGLWLASSAIAIFYSIFAAVAILITLIIVSGAFSAFYSTVLTLTYNQLKNRG